MIKIHKTLTNLTKTKQNSKCYIGIDQSLKCTSISVFTNQTIKIYQIKPIYMGVHRINEIYDTFMEILEQHPEIDAAAIEGYAFQGEGRRFNLGELGGVLRLALYKKKINTIEVPPTYLKKYISGKGNSPKNLMNKEVYKKYDVDLDDDNDVDSFSLAMLCEEYFETEFHLVKAYREDFHLQCKQVIGEHPKELKPSEYLKDMPDVTIAQYEKTRKK